MAFNSTTSLSWISEPTARAWRIVTQSMVPHDVVLFNHRLALCSKAFHVVFDEEYEHVGVLNTNLEELWCASWSDGFRGGGGGYYNRWLILSEKDLAFLEARKIWWRIIGRFQKVRFLQL